MENSNLTESITDSTTTTTTTNEKLSTTTPTATELKSLKRTFSEAFPRINMKSQNEMRKLGEFCDFTLVSKDGIEIKVHKVTISSSSNYFKAVLQTDMNEHRTGRIILDNINGDILEKIVSFMYLGEIDTDNIEIVEEIIKHSEYFQLGELTKLCTTFLKEFINTNTCLKYWRFSEKYFLKEFREKCIEYILLNAQDLFSNESFLNDLNVDELQKLLDDDRIPCTPEFIYETSSKWAKKKTSTNPKEYLDLFLQIIDFIQLPLLNKEFVLLKILTNEELLQDKRMNKKILDCIKFKWSEDCNMRTKFTKSTMPKIGSNRKKAFLTMCCSKIQQLSIDGDLRDFVDFRHSKNDYGYTRFGSNFLLISGGLKTKRSKRDCEYFSPITKEWKDFPEMITKRFQHSCICIGDMIYACGGASSSYSIELIDLNIGKWEAGPKMNSNRVNFGLTSSSGGILYAVGGTMTDQIEMWDPRTSIGWSTVYTSSIVGGEFTRSVLVDSSIYIFDKIQDRQFDTRMYRFVETRKIPMKRCSIDVSMLNDEIGILTVERIIPDGQGRYMKFYRLKPANDGELILKCSIGIDRGHSPCLISMYY